MGDVKLSAVAAIKQELKKFENPEKAAFLPKFFQAFPGGYGEGDQFIGVKVPDLRKTARKFFKDFTLEQAENLLREPVHEYRLAALFILVLKYEQAKTEAAKKAIVDLYLNNIPMINNWDLVDASADKILGSYLWEKDKALLFELARSGQLWKQRIAIISTYHFIKRRQYETTLEIAKILLTNQQDLIHKAVGWMLREIGNRDFEAEFNFLKEHYRKMPRTMLRYAIEKFEESLRQQFLKGLVDEESPK